MSASLVCIAAHSDSCCSFWLSSATFPLLQRPFHFLIQPSTRCPLTVPPFPIPWLIWSAGLFLTLLASSSKLPYASYLCFLASLNLLSVTWKTDYVFRYPPVWTFGLWISLSAPHQICLHALDWRPSLCLTLACLIFPQPASKYTVIKSLNWSSLSALSAFGSNPAIPEWWRI